MKTNVVYSLLSLSLVLFTACSTDSDTPADQALIPVEELAVDLQAELVSHQIDDIAEAVTADELVLAKSASAQKPSLPECVVITTTAEGDVIKRIVDFGSGCMMANGLTYSGKLVMLINRDYELRMADIIVETDAFFVNDLAVIGRKEITRIWPETAMSGVPSSEVVTNLKVVHPEGVYSEVTGTLTREWIEGYGSGTWGDNVVLIGGNRMVKTYMNESLVRVFEAQITEKLRREWACRFIVSGLMNIQKGDFSFTLDYGDGNCDNKAVVTSGTGVSREIVLR